MRFFQFLALGLLLTVSGGMYAQEKQDGWLTPRGEDILKHKMKMSYSKPAGFDELLRPECFKGNPQLSRTITCSFYQLVSMDGECILFLQIYPPFTRQDSIDMTKLIPGYDHDVVDKQHMYHIKEDIRESRGEGAAPHWRDYVTYYRSGEARKKFNADSAIFVPIGYKDPSYYYQGKYSHFEALYLQKKGRGFINFYCFYTDAGAKDIKRYRKIMEGILRYED